MTCLARVLLALVALVVVADAQCPAFSGCTSCTSLANADDCQW
jgi:hypothetical protein